MICHTLKTQISAIELVISAVKSGELSQNDIKKSVTRVQALKTTYLSDHNSTSTNDFKGLIDRQRALASEIYAKSATIVRSDPDFFPLSPKLRKVVLITPGDSHKGGGAVEDFDNYEEDDAITGPTYTSLIEDINPGYLEVIEIKFNDGIRLSTESEKVIEQASVVILATRSAELRPYQKEFGLSLATNIGSKLVVIATCEPYDFLEDVEIKNYVTIYEPTIPAFKAAVDVIFGITKATGILPIRVKRKNHEIQVLSNPSENELQKIYNLWHQIFPKWPISLPRLTKLLQDPQGKYLIHDHGFCLAYLFADGMAKISAIGVLPESRSQGLGTAFISKAREELNQLGEVKSFGIGSVFPRFWAGVPFDVLQEHKDFFLHRGMFSPLFISEHLLTAQGFKKSMKPTARDLYRDITIDVAPPAILKKVADLPLTFSPWSPELYEECMTKQVANFGYNKVLYTPLSNSP